MFSVIANVVVTFLNLSFAMRWNRDLDIDDLFLIYFTDAGVGFLLVALRDLPSMTLFAKITPKRIEATLYALLTSVMNFDILIE